MRRNPAITVGLLIAIAVAMAWCFSFMMGQRFAGGGDYARGSTLNSAPVGAKALYEAVDRLPGTACERNFRRLAKLSDATASADSVVASSRRDHTLVLLSVSTWDFDNGDAIDGDAVRDFAAAGGRVVITVDGGASAMDRITRAAEEQRQELREERRKATKDGPTEKDGPTKEADDKGTREDAKSEPPGKSRDESAREDRRKELKKRIEEEELEMPFKPTSSLVEAIRIDVKRDDLKPPPEDGHELDTPEGVPAVGGKLPRWRGAATLNLNPRTAAKMPKDRGKEGMEQSKPDDSDKPKPSRTASAGEAWKTLATVEDKPVLAERRIGHGSIVVASDSYFATNQALLFDPVPEFLAWLIGDARVVIFDETHLGTEETPGIMTLARRYRLHGFFIGGILLFALFVWQSSSSLVPAQEGTGAEARTVAGQGASAGLVSLLRRGVPRSRLLHACLDQWLRNHPQPNPSLHDRIASARAMLPDAGSRPARGALVSLYQRLCETLHPKRH